MSALGLTRELSLQADGLELQARLYGRAGKAGAVVAPPHPMYGGSMSNGVVQITTRALVESGVCALAFNFRGTEGSQGLATSSLEAATADYRAAISTLRAHVAGPTIAAGYSFGAGTALLCARDALDLRALLLIAPPLGMLRSQDLAGFAGKVLLVVGDRDEYSPLPELRQRLAQAPNVQLQVLPGVDHFFHFGGAPALFTRLKEQLDGWFG